MSPPFVNDQSSVTDRDVALAVLAKRHLGIFVRRAWRYVEQKQPLRWNWHLDEMCQILEAIHRNDRIAVPEDDVAFNIPPGTMKSLLVSVFFPAWEWADDPTLRFLCASHQNDLALRDNVRMRQILTSEWYQRFYPNVLMQEDQNAKERFHTRAGGWRIATSPEGVGIGEHPDRVILDDVLSEDGARSDKQRTETNHWLDRTIGPRGVARGVRRLLVGQRLHHEDATAHVVAKGGWRLVVFPMRFIPSRPPNSATADPGFQADPRDHRSVAGELLFPSLLNEEQTRKLEIKLGPYGTAGQLQQQPVPEGGGLFKRVWFKFVSAAPVQARRVRCWDTAATEDGGDWTVGARIAEVNDLIYVEHVYREQLSPAGVDAAMLSFAHSDGVATSIRELREPAAAGKTVIAARTKHLKGFGHKEITVSKDKVTQSKPFRAQVEAGNVYIVRTGDTLRDAWIEPFLTELENFPVFSSDDQVDAVSNGYNAVILEPSLTAPLVVRASGF